MLKEFKEFALRGNVLDLAVGVIIGGAFGKIVTSLVNDIVMPVLGLILGRINLSGLKYDMLFKEDGTPALTLSYGAFLQNVIDFLIIAFSIFLMIKLINSFKRKKKEEEKKEEAKPTAEQALLIEIRDLLKNNMER